MKVYKLKDKLIIYLPFEVINKLELKGNDEVDFFTNNESSFLFARKGGIKFPTNIPQIVEMVSGPVSVGDMTLAKDEINLLKKLDTLRYPNRTVASVNRLLNESEKKVLQSLINKKIVALVKKDGLYSISKDIYDKFLMRKKSGTASQKKEEPILVIQPQVAPVRIFPKVENENVRKLEEEGFVVLHTEAEASTLSLAIENSIRTGKVLGIRAFNKKFYVILRAFFDKNSGKIIKELREGPKSVSELVKTTSLNEDGIRAMLYLLSEQGDVSERRRDVFTLI